MLWIKLLKKLFKALNADASPGEIAGGVILGMVIGLTPLFTLTNFFIIALIIVLKVNVSGAIFSALIFGIVGYFIDPAAHILGEAVLTAGSLEGLWTVLYNTPVIPLTLFNNTVVMGTLLISLILMIPLYFIVKKLVKSYRKDIQEKVQKLKIVKILKASKLYKIYRRVKV
ncbi:MAG: TIGR03546 family protein [Elusimicrobiota bacterium]